MQVFSKEWFMRHQKKLLWLANCDKGKDLLRIGNDVPDGKRIVRILPNCVTWLEEVTRKGEVVLTTDFRTHDKFGKRLFYGLHPLWSTLHWLDEVFINKRLPELSFGFDTLTAYPAAGAVSPSDGFVYTSTGDVVYLWADLRDLNTNIYISDTDYYIFVGGYAIKTSSTSANIYNEINRGVVMFDTSMLANTVKYSATLSLYGKQQTNQTSATDTQAAVTIASVKTASSSSLSTSDYALSNWGTIRFATDLPYSGWSTSSYNNFNLNASGVAYIASSTGITKIGTRYACDFDNTPPSTATPYYTFTACYSADQTGTSQDPKLVVTYRLAGGDFFPFF